VYSAEIENEEIFHQQVLRSVKPFATAPRPMKVCDSPRSNLSMCALIGVENILDLPCEL